MQEVVFRRQRFGNPQHLINRLISKKIKFALRKSSECTQIQIGDTLFTYTSQANFPRNKLFLFNLVKRDVVKWIGKKTTLELPNEFPVTKYNESYPYDRSIGIDLNHAYWRIAYNQGMISEKTYKHGLDPECKALRLATLSVLGRNKEFEIYEEGVLVDKETRQQTNLVQKEVFKYIRLVCFDMMNTISRKLGNDFDAWKTDCIYFYDTPENRKKVTDFFDKKNMTYKILDYFEED